MTEHAIAIARVSSMKQHEEDQRPGLQAYADRKGYTLDEMIPVHGRSAFHGKHVKHILAAVDKHVRNGQASIVIFRHVDRSSREGVFEGFDLLKKIMDAGARVEFSEQEYLTEQPGLIGLFFDLAKKESEIKQDRKVQGNAAKRARGELVGSVPWGYEPVMRDDVRVGIKPSPLGRKWVPLVFHAAAEGKTLRTISDILRGVPSPARKGVWDMTTLARLIANPTYHGSMRGNPNMKFEPLVPVELWQKANLAVKTRSNGGRGVLKGEPRFVIPVCDECLGVQREGCPDGVSPMYISTTTNRQGRTYRYYYCRGTGPVRKGCGAPVIPVPLLDEAIDRHMAADTRPHPETKFVPGDDTSEARALINEKIRVAQEAGDYLLVAQLAQEAMAIGPSERKAELIRVDSGITVGQHWQGLSPAEKRDELTRWRVYARRGGRVRIEGPWREDGKSLIGDAIAADQNVTPVLATAPGA